MIIITTKAGLPIVGTERVGLLGLVDLLLAGVEHALRVVQSAAKIKTHTQS